MRLYDYTFHCIAIQSAKSLIESADRQTHNQGCVSPRRAARIAPGGGCTTVVSHRIAAPRRRSVSRCTTVVSHRGRRAGDAQHCRDVRYRVAVAPRSAARFGCVPGARTAADGDVVRGAARCCDAIPDRWRVNTFRSADGPRRGAARRRSNRWRGGYPAAPTPAGYPTRPCAGTAPAAMRLRRAGAVSAMRMSRGLSRCVALRTAATRARDATSRSRSGAATVPAVRREPPRARRGGGGPPGPRRRRAAGAAAAAGGAALLMRLAPGPAVACHRARIPASSGITTVQAPAAETLPLRSSVGAAPRSPGSDRAAVAHSRNDSSRSGSASGFGIHTGRPASVSATPSSTRLALPGRTASTITASPRFGFTLRWNTTRCRKSTSVTSSVTPLTCAA